LDKTTQACGQKAHRRSLTVTTCYSFAPEGLETFLFVVISRQTKNLPSGYSAPLR